MAASGSSVFSGLSSTLFQPLPADVSALQETCMNVYLDSLPDFATILKELQLRGFFL